jgi:hypothetical protein
VPAARQRGVAGRVEVEWLKLKILFAKMETVFLFGLERLSTFSDARLGFLNLIRQGVALLWVAKASTNTGQHNIQHTHKRQTSMSPAGSEPAIPATEAKTYALDCAAITTKFLT